MPKSSPTASPTSNTIPKPVSDAAARMTDVALRKKKNADAQAAFRARRANYIATLEETVTSLESVVIQLQESCRESRAEAIELRQENNRLRMEQRERERFWRALYHAKKTGQAPEADDLTPPPPPLSSPFPGHAQVTAMSSSSNPSLVSPQYGNRLGYRDDSVVCQTSYDGLSGSSPPGFGSQSSAQFPNPEISNDGSSGPSVNVRSSKYLPYPYPVSRDGRWQGTPTIPLGVGPGEPITPPHSQSPVYTESPSLTSTEMSAYPGRFSAEEQKVSLNSVLDSAPYIFPNGDRINQNLGDSVPNSRSMSPTASTTSSTTSLPLTSSFQFTFHEAPSGQDSEFDYRRQSLPHCPEVTLHGGTADVSLTGQSSDVIRYRASRRPDLSAEHQSMLGVNDSAHHEQSDGDVPPSTQLARSRLDILSSNSRSPSPGSTPVSCTVAVIKAQAFGALRRTRARTKKSSEGAAKVAMNVLEARGIEIGSVSTGSKRPRMDDEVMEIKTP